MKSQNEVTIARNQYRATLSQLSFEALYRLAKEEYGIEGKVTRPASDLIEQILNAKYGKENT